MARRYGPTDPVSTDKPSEDDLVLSKILDSVLRERNSYEPEERSRQREEVLGRLSEIIQEWVRDSSLEVGLSEEIAREQDAKIFTSGSYKLGVHSASSDIDTIVVVPRHITRDHFFDGLGERLAQVEEIEHLVPVRGAMVPVIKFEFDTVEIDLLFARVSVSTIPEEFDINDNKVLSNVDKGSQRSLCGPRDTMKLLEVVPHQQTFCTVLRMIKIWAKERAVYSNKFGYPGGIALAILVARICQLWQNAAPSKVLMMFFVLYSKWEWPKPIELVVTEKVSGLDLEVWDRRLPKYRRDLAPVLTPAYPAFNSTYNVNKSTLAVLKKEWERGRAIMGKLYAKMEEKTELPEQEIKAAYQQLLEPSDFFLDFGHYLFVNLEVKSEDNLEQFKGMVESRVRHLVSGLEPPYCYGIKCTPYPFGQKDPKNPKSITFYLGLEFEKKGNHNLFAAKAYFLEEIRKSTLKSGHAEDDFSCTVGHIKATELPDHVFRDERRPKKKKKKKKKKRNRENGTPRENSTASAVSPSTSKKRQKVSEETDEKESGAAADGPETKESGAPREAADDKTPAE
eukprot:CAMPEP_0114498866 /NCGR_PEP_ID=MMETSP0109-20121206/7107_1 /TAXON_ID=29199 /ORGANISM="Chlorarachnion reptans, Strain CCCM449" /LENGTH=565 /DNA_ID=CAMNT_0001676385 /DNA_START=190 /DNA_END=1887 /DNA_ORIENTATION=-